VIGPNITHAPCDLEQQRRRTVAARERLARAVIRRRRGRGEDVHLSAPSDAEDVLHALR
jgi:hypothetical protein